MKYEFSLSKEIEERAGEQISKILEERSETIRARIAYRRDTTENWEKNNPRLLNGELGIEYTLDGDIRMKVGNGKNRWNNLKYVNENFIISTIDNNPKIKLMYITLLFLILSKVTLYKVINIDKILSIPKYI